MIKIGVDARSLSRSVTGIGRYTMDMCKILATRDDVELHLYSPAKVLPEYRQQLKLCFIKDFKSNKSGLFRQIWGETFLPYWAYKDQVDVFWGPSHRLPRILASSCLKTVTIHDMVWHFAGDTMKPVSKILERIQMPHSVKVADKIIVSSKATMHDLHKLLNVRIDKMSLVYPAIDIRPSNNPMPSYSAIDEKLENQTFAIFVGTLEPRKNLLRLLEAYSNMPEQTKNKCHIVIIGGKGWGKLELQKKTTELNIDHFVHFTGYVNEQTLQYLYSQARFLMMPSLYEGFGLPISEAMKYGTPSIAGDNSSMPEVVGPAGLLVEAKSVASITDALIKLINDDVLRNNLSQKAMEQVKIFEANKSVDALLSVFKKGLRI